MHGVDELDRIVRRLLADDGCPWDRAQTPESMAPFLLEEAVEAAGALAGSDPEASTSELGDVLFTLALIGALREARGEVGLDGIGHASAAKMVARHPRLFGHPEDGRTWDELKGSSTSIDDVPQGLPALLRAQKVGRRAAKRGFDWPDREGPRAKIREELQELDEALLGDDIAHVREEVGDLLFSVVNLARHLGIDAESALLAATTKFVGRFERLETHVQASGADVSTLDAGALESTWQALKEH